MTPTSVLALRIKGESVAADEHKLRAEVDLNGAEADTVTVMGVTSKADENTELELDDVPFGGSVASFLGMIDDDADPTNGSRDVVEVKIDTTNGNGTPDESYRADEIETEEEDD